MVRPPRRARDDRGAVVLAAGSQRPESLAAVMVQVITPALLDWS
jgi:hypothetical protein